MMRCPSAGSRPVVSVSTTISRISAPGPFCECRHDGFHLFKSMIDTLVGLHHKMRARALIHIRHLAGEYMVEGRFAHARPRQYACPLYVMRCGDDDDRVHIPFTAGFKKQWNIEDDHFRTGGGGLFDKRPLIRRDERMNNRFQPGEGRTVSAELSSETAAIDVAFGHAIGKY